MEKPDPLLLRRRYNLEALARCGLEVEFQEEMRRDRVNR
jgi:hypothetical protein